MARAVEEMTTEEAIKELKFVKEVYLAEFGEQTPAIDMAIKALERELEGVISREEVKR